MRTSGQYAVTTGFQTCPSWTTNNAAVLKGQAHPQHKLGPNVENHRRAFQHRVKMACLRTKVRRVYGGSALPEGRTRSPAQRI